MKYFTYELWKNFNSSDETVRKKASNDWLSNIELYKNEFKKAEAKLSTKFLNLLKRNDYFHDFHIIKAGILQSNKHKYPSVSLIITQDNEAYEVIYTKVKKIDINYSFEANELGFDNGFCTWGYSEFLVVDDKLISHEILFSSGARILLWFETVKGKRIVINQYKAT